MVFPLPKALTIAVTFYLVMAKHTSTPSISVASVNEKPAEIRATFIVSPNLIRKLKLIGMLENRKHKDVINEALSVFISKWESEHPTVDLMQIDNLAKG